MNPHQFAALIGFLSIAAWATVGFADAILCLIGAAVFAALSAVQRGELDLGDLQQRLSSQEGTRRPAR